MRVLAVLLVVAAGGLIAVLPPAARVVGGDAGPGPRLVRGSIHVHTRRSDGTGTVDDVARAAAAAGLSFVIITDHGDASRMPDPPTYREGVLCIDAVEISTSDGHVVALGLPQAPYPLGGEARDVVEDIHRLGGWALAAHPGSPKPDLAWRAANVPVDGIEWVNGDSEWRDESVFSLVRALLTYPFRQAESLATLLDRPDAVMRQWDTLTAERAVVGLAASDAHARVGLTSLGEPYDARASLPLPSYRAVFSAMSITLDDVVLSSDAATDARAVEQAIRDGRAYSTIDGLARSGRLAFSATSGDRVAAEGQRLLPDGDVTLRISVSGLPGVRTTLMKNGSALQVIDGAELQTVVPPERAVYRVEIGLARAAGEHPVPWMVSNPIYVGLPEAGTRVPAAGEKVPVQTSTDQLAGAGIERSEASEGAVSMTRGARGPELLFRYALGGRSSEHPYAAAVLPVSRPLNSNSRIRFSARSAQAMRVSVQLRRPGPSGGDRWRRSVYLDETPRDIVIPLGDMRGVENAARLDGPVGVDSLLFVVDDVNTKMGFGGRVWISNLTVE